MIDPDLPRIEDFRSDLTADAIADAEARNVRSIAMQGYLSAFPAWLQMRQLTEYIQGRRYLAPEEAPLGGWFLMRELSTPKVTTVSPNVDTLYGASHVLLDLQGPIVATVPPIDDRYSSLTCMDAYWNVFAIVSPRTFGTNGGDFLIVPPGWDGTVPDGITAVFHATTPSIVLIQRIWVHGPEDYAIVRPLQDEIRLAPLAGWRTDDPSFPEVDLSAYAIDRMRDTRDPLRFFELMNAYTGENPPTWLGSGVIDLLRTADVGPGSVVPREPEKRAAIAAGAADAQAIMNARITAGRRRDGWRVPDPMSGLLEQGILDDAVVAATQMGISPLDEAIYFFAYRDAEDRPLDGSGGYTLTFAGGALPPLHDYGFWSLTMYGEDSLLVANPIDRYAIRGGDADLVRDPDGGLTIHIAAGLSKGTPEPNWLPAPRGAFNVALRTYLPQRSIVDGAWFPPGLVRDADR